MRFIIYSTQLHTWHRLFYDKYDITYVILTSELYIYLELWSKNFSHSVYVKSEAKDGGHWRPKSM